MNSITEKIKKKAKKFKEFISVRYHKHWQKHPDVLNRLEPFFHSTCLTGFYGVGEPDHRAQPLEAPRLYRWKHLGCLEDTRVKLTLGPVDYIHANYISTPEHPKRIIATQPPLDNTAADFWYMVVQEKSEIIISLCPLDEKTSGDKRTDFICSDYFYTNPKTNLGLSYLDDRRLSVTVWQTTELEYEQNGVKATIYRRHIEINLRGGGGKQECHHYHWVWDQKLTNTATSISDAVPPGPSEDKDADCDSLPGWSRPHRVLRPVSVFQYYLDLLKAEHCEREILPPGSYLSELRQQRHNIIETVYQFYFIHMVLLKYFSDETGKVHEDLEKFTTHYESFMEIMDHENVEGSTNLPK